jgi:hypothetical protein
MGAQSANSWTAKYALTYVWSNSKKTSSDYKIKAIAIAPYFGYYLGAPSNESQVEAWTRDADGGLNKLFTEITTGGVLVGGPTGGALAQAYDQMSQYMTLARQKNLQLIAYEGGQHLSGFLGVENNTAITNLFQRANRDPRMGQIYTQYLNKWRDMGGGIFNHFSSISAYDKWGSWGSLENINQTTAPKYDALLAAINSGM